MADSYELEFDVSGNQDFKLMCSDVKPHAKLPETVILELRKDGTIMQFMSSESSDSDDELRHMLIHPQEDGVSLRKWLDAFGLKPNPWVIKQELNCGVLKTDIVRKN